MQLGPGEQPFLTQDSILAYALYLAFTEFVDDEMPCVNHYKLDDLRRLGYKGKLPTEAALQAVKDGRKGTVDFMYKQPDGTLLRAFEEQKNYLRDGEGFARDAVRDLLEDYKSGGRPYEETIVRLVCTMIHMRAAFVSLWKAMVPLIRVDDIHRSEQRNGDSTTVSYGGFRFVSANASEETKKKLGVT